MRVLPLLLLSVNLDALKALGVELPDDNPTAPPDPTTFPGESPEVTAFLNGFAEEAEAAGLVDVLQAHGCEAWSSPAVERDGFGVFVKVRVMGQTPAAGAPACQPFPIAGESALAYQARGGQLPTGPDGAPLNPTHKWDPWGIPDGHNAPGRWIPDEAPFTSPPGSAPVLPDDAD